MLVGWLGFLGCFFGFMVGFPNVCQIAQHLGHVAQHCHWTKQPPKKTNPTSTMARNVGDVAQHSQGPKLKPEQLLLDGQVPEKLFCLRVFSASWLLVRSTAKCQNMLLFKRSLGEGEMQLEPRFSWERVPYTHRIFYMHSSFIVNVSNSPEKS